MDSATGFHSESEAFDAISLLPYFRALERIEPMPWNGSVSHMSGLLVESAGPSAAINDFCEIRTASGRRVRTQVIGFRDGRVLSMPLEETDGVQLGDRIVSTRR